MTGLVFDSLLNHSYSLARIRRTPDGQGGWAIDYVPTGTVPGRLRPASASESLAAAQESRSLTHVLYVRYGTDIQRGDRVTGAGQEVYVDGVREPSTAHEHLEVDCSTSQVEVSVEDGS